MNLVETELLAKKMMSEHGLTGWKFKYDRSMRRFGCCHHAQNTISLSRTLTLHNERNVVIDVILHEIAHALVGGRAGHNITWKKKAQQLGCRPVRCYDSNAVVTPPPKYIATCPHCGKVILRYRRTRLACGDCCRRYSDGRFDYRFEFQWAENLNNRRDLS